MKTFILLLIFLNCNLLIASPQCKSLFKSQNTYNEILELTKNTRFKIKFLKTVKNGTPQRVVLLGERVLKTKKEAQAALILLESIPNQGRTSPKSINKLYQSAKDKLRSKLFKSNQYAPQATYNLEEGRTFNLPERVNRFIKLMSRIGPMLFYPTVIASFQNPELVPLTKIIVFIFFPFSTTEMTQKISYNILRPKYKDQKWFNKVYYLYQSPRINKNIKISENIEVLLKENPDMEELLVVVPQSEVEYIKHRLENLHDFVDSELN